MPLVSIIIPVYNAAATLAETIESALAQRDADAGLEIVVVDDGSTDTSLEVARRYEPAVRVLTGPNRGVSAARNRGIAECRGEWLLFLDADDVLQVGTLAKRLAVAGKGLGDVIVCDWQDMNTAGRVSTDVGPRAFPFDRLEPDREAACAAFAWAANSALMFRGSLVREIGGFREELAVVEDARLLFDAVRHRARLVHAPHVGTHIRVLPGSLSRASTARFWRNAFANGRQIEALWREQGTLGEPRREAIGGIFRSAASNLFRANDPAFFEVHAAMRAGGYRIGLRQQAAIFLTKLLGQTAAIAIAKVWSALRRFVTRRKAVVAFGPESREAAGRPRYGAS